MLSGYQHATAGEPGGYSSYTCDNCGPGVEADVTFGRQHFCQECADGELAAMEPGSERDQAVDAYEDTFGKGSAEAILS